MKKYLSFALLPFLLLSCGQGGNSGDPKSLEGYNLVWEDDFEGDSLNPDYWTYETGNNGGWGNQELEYYTEDNATVSDGILTIEARKENKEIGRAHV